MTASVTQTGNAIDTVNVQIGPQFLNLFSEHLYSSPNKAFEELISNSWDAGATAVDINVPDDLHHPETGIWVWDNGMSMDVDGFRALWSVATSSKRDVSPEKMVRKPIGKFGVGKLATYLLANEITYVCKAADGIIRAITMDYRRIDEQEKTALHIDPLPLQVRQISEAELPELFATLPKNAELMDLITNGHQPNVETTDYTDEYGGGPSDGIPPTGTWTVVAMTSLKPQGQRISVGWVKRLLATSLPLGNTIAISLNGEAIESAKATVPIAKSWTLGPGLGLNLLTLPNGEEIGISEHASPYPHLQIDGIGEVSGQFTLYADRISGGKSNLIEVSNGFFVNIRGRVVKPDDPYFGLENLSHSAWSRFRATVRADDLDQNISVNRENISDSDTLDVFKALLRKIFNLARSEYNSQFGASWPDVGDIILERWGTVPFAPLKRVIRDNVADMVDLPSFVRIKPDADRGAVLEEWNSEIDKSDSEIIRDVVFSMDMDKTERLSVYDLESRKIFVNQNHPFSLEHQEDDAQRRVLRDTALVDTLTEAFLVDMGLSIDQAAEISNYKDHAFRLVAQVRRKSAPQLAAMLLAATDKDKAFERIIGDSLDYLGFSVERLGASGEPEGVATAIISAHPNDDKASFTFTYDAKSAEKGVVKTGNVGVAGLVRHRKDHGADHTLVVGPSFQVGALEAECKEHHVTPITAKSLAKLVMATVGFGPIDLAKFREIFGFYGPSETEKWVDDYVNEHQAREQISLGVLIGVLEEICSASSIPPDTIHCSTIADRYRTKISSNNFPQRTQVRAALNGLALIAPTIIQMSGEDVMLGTQPHKLREQINAQLGVVPIEYRYGIARDELV
jgi:hypothetical protein